MATALAPITQTDVDPILAAAFALPLPYDPDDARRRWNLRTATAAWLRSRKSDHTRKAYFRDLSDYLAWCEHTGLDPRDAKRGDVDAYTAARCADLSDASTARRLSTISSWYKYLISNEVAANNPVDAVDRPKVSHDDSPTIGLTGKQVAAFIDTARARTGRTALRDAALLGMLAQLGLRVGEVLGLDVDSLTHRDGHRVVRVLGKGRKPRWAPITGPLARDLDAYLAQRAQCAGVPVDELTGPVFVTASGQRVSQPFVFVLVRRVAAEAGIPSADKLSPHSLRHTFATVSREEGVPLEDVQDAMGHADPRTTRRYDRDRHNLDRSPAYRIAKLFSHHRA